LRETDMPLIETRGAGSAQGFGEFAQSAAVNYIEDVFSTYLYTGNSTSGGTQTITNDIDLSTKGGLVWIKGRSAASDHILTDTVRGVGASATDNNALASNLTSAQDLGGSSYDFLSAFSTTGFTVKQGGTTTATRGTNYDAVTYASWTFRKQAKFFDVVTWTGDNVNGRVIPHSLNAEVGFIVVKAITTSANDNNWVCRHRSQTSPDRLYLNTTAAASGSTNLAPTTTGFTVYANGYNETGVQYVAYLFAHNAGGFGLSGTDNVISCGSFTGTATVDLGYEPQYILFKSSSAVGNWFVQDNMRGFGTNTSAYLNPNLANAEATWNDIVTVTSTGFKTASLGSNTYIYIAIRRGPMKVPTSGTSVFSPVTQTTGTPTTTTTAGFPVDLWIEGFRAGGVAPRVGSRLIGADYLETSTTNGTQAGSNFKWDSNTTVTQDSSSGLSIVSWMWRRAPGFFDVVCDTGTGSAHTITHNLGVVPELMIRKKRSATDAWIVYANNDNTDYLVLNTTAATVDDITMWNDTSPTSSVFTVGTNDDVNGNTATFVTYLFATLAGVSKVGSYTGTGTTLQIDCGFTGGARFVLIKRTDSTGDWYVYDTARGIVSGNDSYLLLNSTAAEVTNTDYVDTYSAGFELSSTAPAALNANGGTFIFFAVA
jgi:hypothetical protein